MARGRRAKDTASSTTHPSREAQWQLHSNFPLSSIAGPQCPFERPQPSCTFPEVMPRPVLENSVRPQTRPCPLPSLLPVSVS